MAMPEHAFASDDAGRVVVSFPGFATPWDYTQTRASQLRALSTLMTLASNVVGEIDDELRADLLSLSVALSSEIADALGQIVVKSTTS